MSEDSPRSDRRWSRICHTSGSLAHSSSEYTHWPMSQATRRLRIRCLAISFWTCEVCQHLQRGALSEPVADSLEEGIEVDGAMGRERSAQTTNSAVHRLLAQDAREVVRRKG